MREARKGVVDRALDDTSSDRLWKARDRLTAAVKADPANQEVLSVLGEVYFKMGDLPSAGRFWILTERSGVEAEAAAAALEERWGGNLGEKLKMIPFRPPAEAYPPPVRERIHDLQQEAMAAGIEWPRKRPDAGDDDEGMAWHDWLVLGVAGLLGPGLWLLGIAAAIYLIVRLVF